MAGPAVIPAGSVGRGIVCPPQTVVLRGSNPGTTRGLDLLVFAFEKNVEGEFCFPKSLEFYGILVGRVGLELGPLKFRTGYKCRALP